MIRHALRGLVNAVLLLLVIVIAVLALIQTAPGKRFLADRLSAALTSPDAGVEIIGIEGWVPIDLRIEELRLADRNGVWLAASKVGASWSPSALLRGRIEIDAISAEHIRFARPPLIEEQEPANDGPFKLPELPTSLPPITLDRLSVPRLDFEAPVLGEAASFELEGSLTASDDGRHADLTLELRRYDQQTAFATLISTVSLAPATLAIDLDAGETGGLVARLLDRPDAGDLDLSLTGEGPLDAWSGELRIDAEGLGSAEAEIALALIEQPRLSVSSKVQAAPSALPAEIRELVGDHLALDLTVTQTGAQALAIEQLELAAEGAGLTAEGAVDFDREDLALKASLNAPDLGAFSGLANASLAGAADLSIEVDGELLNPNGRLDLRVNSLRLNAIDIDEIEGRLDWQSVGSATSAQTTFAPSTFTLSTAGSAKGIRVPDIVLPDTDLAWTAAVTAPLEGEITVQEAIIRTAESTLRAEGAIDPATLIGGFDVALDIPGLRRLTEPYGQDQDGRMTMTAALETSRQAETVTIDLDASFDDLSGMPPGMAELLGKAVDLEADISLDERRHLAIDRLVFRGANGTLSGRAGFDLVNEALDGKLALALPRLDVFAPLIERDIEGAADLSLDLGGKLGAPIVDARLSAETLTVETEVIEALTLEVNGRALRAAPEGSLALGLTTRGAPAELALDYQLEDGSLQLRQVVLSGAETALGGDLTIDLDRTLIDGKLEGGIGDLSAFEPILQQSLRGQLDLNAEFSAKDDRQGMVLSAIGRDLEGDFGRIDELTLDGSLSDLLEQPEIGAKALVSGFAQDGITLSRVALGVDGGLEQLDLELALEGQASKPISIDAIGALSLADTTKLTIDRLDGAFAEEPIRLAKPVSATFNDDTLAISDLDLRFGAASLKGGIDIRDRQAKAGLDLRAVPLTWIEAFDGPALTGTLSADLDIDGTVSSPRIDALVKLAGLDAKVITSEDVPPLDIQASARLADGQLRTSLAADRLGSRTVTVDLSHPLRLELLPWKVELPEDGALSGSIDAEILLEWLADLLLLDEQKLKGQLLAKLELSGSLADPIVRGPIELSEGRYENNETGTELSQVTLKAAADRKTINISSLSGRVGRDGTIEGEGEIALDPEANIPLSVAILLTSAQLIARDDLEATISGRIAMTGDLVDPHVEGKLTVNQAEVFIPDGGGVDVPEIEVEEIGARIINLDEEPKDRAKPFDPTLAVDIDIPNRFFVRGRGLESEGEGKLKVAGKASAPSLTGYLNIRTGYFDFLDRRLDLTTGETTFGGEFPPDPIINVEARASDGDFTAIFKVTGAASNPYFTITSEPALPEDQVLARLLFDRNLSEISALEAGQLALALNRLRGGGGGFDAFGEIRNILNIDTLEFVGGDTNSESKVRAGKYLSEGVFVEVEDGAGQGSGRARVELEIFPNVTIEADTGQDSVTGFDIKWRLDY
ncbi:MAG: translocation/assembly module TamB domain-containing protein [Geminicoccaceae bacterium]